MLTIDEGTNFASEFCYPQSFGYLRTENFPEYYGFDKTRQLLETYSGSQSLTVWYYKDSANLSIWTICSGQWPRMVHSSRRPSQRTELDSSDRLMGVDNAEPGDKVETDEVIAPIETDKPCFSLWPPMMPAARGSCIG